MEPIEFVKIFGLAAGLHEVKHFGVSMKNGSPSLTYHAEGTNLHPAAIVTGLATAHAYRTGVEFFDAGIELHNLPQAYKLSKSAELALGCTPELTNDFEKSALLFVDFEKVLSHIAPTAYLIATCWHHHHDVLNIICEHVSDGQEFLFSREDIKTLINENVAPLIRLGNQDVWAEYGVQTHYPVITASQVCQ